MMNNLLGETAEGCKSRDSERMKSPSAEPELGDSILWEGKILETGKRREDNNRFGAPTRGFTAYAVPGAAERTMTNFGAGIAPGEPHVGTCR